MSSGGLCQAFRRAAWRAVENARLESGCKASPARFRPVDSTAALRSSTITIMATKLAVVWLLALLADDPLTGWKDFSPKDAGFQVKIPGVPRETKREIGQGASVTKFTLWGIEKDGVVYMVMRTELPPEAVAGGTKKTLDEARDSGVKNSRGTLKEEKEIEMDGYPGRELVLDLPDSRVRGGGFYRSRIYLVGQTHYQVATMWPKSGARPDETTAFLNSFRLKNDKSKDQKRPD